MATNPQKLLTLPSLSGGRPAELGVPSLSLLFFLNKLTSFWNALCLEILFQLMLRLPQQSCTLTTMKTAEDLLEGFRFQCLA